MSLNVYLEMEVDTGGIHTRTWHIYDANITHNLASMANAVDIYVVIWEPESLGYSFAGLLVPRMKDGLAELKRRPEYYRKFNAKNGWGIYENLIEFVEGYLHSCECNPNATIRVSR